MPDLPSDIIADTLSRLPVKTLLPFRCVSKPWCALIDSPDFIKLHLNRSIQNNDYLSLVFNSTELYYTDLDSLTSIVELNHPFKNWGVTIVMGSCNGLLLLSNKNVGVAIWNMSTRKYHKLPDTPVQPKLHPDYFRYMSYGFGYDPISDDYKVVRIVQLYYEKQDTFSSEVKVFSLKLNSWKKVQDLPYYLCFRCEWGVFAGGALHWFVKERRLNKPTLVVAFDLGDEEYSLLPQPEYSEQNFDMGMEALGGCICITCSYDINEHVDIWVMKEYGVKGSWTKLLLVKPQSFLIREFLKPMAYSKAGDKILFNCDGEKLFWYDLEGKTFEEVTFNGERHFPSSYYVSVSVGSLVQLGGTGQIDGVKRPGQEKRKDQKNKKQRDDFLSEGFKLVL